MKNIFILFISTTTISLILLTYIIYKQNSFNNHPLSSKVLVKIKQKEFRIKKLIMQKYNQNISIPIIISSKMQNSLFGMAIYDKDNIRIVLNKDRFQESEQYMIDYVLPHEYAHVLMFIFNDFTKKNSGHSKRWQNICLQLEGKKCDRFVKDNDILMGKIGTIY